MRHDNRLGFVAQRVALTGPEPDPVAQRRAAQPGLAMPHDLISRFRVMFAVAIAAQMRDQPYRALVIG